MTSPAGPGPTPLARWGWPIGIIVVLAASVVFNFYVMFVARSDQAFAVEPDYYAKAVSWDAHMAQERANAALGWHARANLTLATTDAAGHLLVSLQDANGKPVTGARISVDAMHNARASQRYAATLTESQAGQYLAQLSAHRSGEWEVRLTASRGAERFTDVLRLTAR